MRLPEAQPQNACIMDCNAVDRHIFSRIKLNNNFRPCSAVVVSFPFLPVDQNKSKCKCCKQNEMNNQPTQRLLFCQAITREIGRLHAGNWLKWKQNERKKLYRNCNTGSFQARSFCHDQQLPLNGNAIRSSEGEHNGRWNRRLTFENPEELSNCMEFLFFS